MDSTIAENLSPPERTPGNTFVVIAIERPIEGSDEVRRSEARIDIAQMPEMTSEMFQMILNQLEQNL